MNYRELREELKNGQEGIPESICEDIMGFQRTRDYDLMHMKQKK
jgi:hypothetical protein